MTTITVTSKGQVTLPAEFRSELRIRAGTQLSARRNDCGEIVLKPKTGDIRALRGFLKYDGPPVSLEDIDRGIAEAVAARYARSSE